MRVGLCLLLQAGVPAFGESQKVAEEPQIQDNSFLIEEAYNQEFGVVQHINTFSRLWNSKDWGYTFTQEWPGFHNWRNQYSYTLVAAHAGAFTGTGVGWGDILLNYRYQVFGNGESRMAFAPRVSVSVPSGDVTLGRGMGAPGLQVNLPLSFVLSRRLVTHWNAGCTFIPHAQGPDHSRAASAGYNLGQSFVFIASSRLNFMLETTDFRYQSVTGPGQTAWTEAMYVSPGVRWAYNFKNGLQIVPGIAMPIGVGGSTGERGIFLYLSFEHPFGKLHPAS
jgi:hypothetical protein